MRVIAGGMPGGEDRISMILHDLIGKYEALSKKFDESFGKMSLSQLTRQVDALTRLARLIISYRGLLELEERERELTRLLSEVRREVESGKHSLRTVKTYGAGSLTSIEELAGKLLDELRRIKLTFMGGGEVE